MTTYGSGGWQAYCEKRWGKNKRTIDRQIKAYRLYYEQEGNMGPMGPNFDERLYRELGQLKTKEYRTAAVLAILDRYGPRPTAEQVREVVDEILGKRRPKKKPFMDIETDEEKQEQDRQAQAEDYFDHKSREANESYFMKIRHLEEDLRSVIDNYAD